MRVVTSAAAGAAGYGLVFAPTPLVVLPAALLAWVAVVLAVLYIVTIILGIRHPEVVPKILAALRGKGGP